MPYLTRINKQETNNLTKLQRLENEALSLTIKSLSNALEAAFNAHTNLDNIKITHAANHYTHIYAASMIVSWLLGQAHIHNAIDSKEKSIELTYAPIYLAVDDVPFQEAIEALNAMIPTDTKEYRQMEAAMKLRAFTVANVSSIDAVNRVKKRYEEALASGASRSETLGNLRSLLEQEGLSEVNPYWLELHYRNNMMTAYNAGRWTQIAHNELVEYLVYSSVLDSGTTELCRKLDGVIKLKTDAFWKKYYPPNHHKCRATVSVLSRKQFDALPATIKRQSDSIDRQALNQDATMRKEHQFTSSPLEGLKILPASMMERAEQYQLIPAILQQLSKDSASLINQQAKTAMSKGVSSRVIDRSVKESPKLDPFREMIASRQMQSPDELALMFHTVADGDMEPMLGFAVQLDDEYWSVAMAPVLNAARVQSLYLMTNKEWQARAKAPLTIPKLATQKTTVFTHQDINGTKAITKDKTHLSTAVEQFIDEMSQGKAKPQGKTWLLAELPQSIRTSLAKAGIVVKSNVIGIRDGQIFHMLRDDKAKRKFKGQTVDKRLPVSFLQTLDQQLDKPMAILQELNQDKPTLLYLYKLEDGRYAKLSIRLDGVDKVERNNVVASWIRSGEIIADLDSLKSTYYKLLEGSLR